ncbi:MAG: phosphatidylglycerophosphate synthase [Campylobacter sp.]|nr:phosphatidylglycerophosphate synthase [Campylobacter sp.]
MNELEILKEIGIKEISRKTHIEPIFLQSIIDKDFSKLLRLNAKGYIKILQREYNIDLGWWLEEYEAFLFENKPDDSHKTKINPKISSYTSDEITNQRLSGGTSLGWLFWVVVLAVLAGGAYYFDAYKYLENLKSFFDDENKSAVYSESSIVSEVKQNIIDTNVTITQNDNSADLNTDKTDSEQKATVAVEQNLSVADASSQDTKLDQNAGTQSSALEKLTTSISVKDSNTSEVIGAADQATIMPKQKVWIGIINLENGKKISTDSNQNIVVNLKQKQLIVCGNGSIELKIGDQISRFNPSKPARFLVENGEIKSISYDEFIALNKGKSW